MNELILEGTIDRHGYFAGKVHFVCNDEVRDHLSASVPYEELIDDVRDYIVYNEPFKFEFIPNAMYTEKTIEFVVTNDVGEYKYVGKEV